MNFLIVGQRDGKNPRYVKMIADKGYDIANHSYSHFIIGVLDTDRIEKEILSFIKDKLTHYFTVYNGKIRSPYFTI